MGVYAGPDVSESGLVLALDASNKKSYSQNEFLTPTDIFATITAAANAATLSRDTISSPVGNTPLKMIPTGNDPYTQATPFIPATVGQTWVVSVYVKANVSTTGQIFIFNANTSGAAFVNGSWVGISATTFNITTEWARVSWYLTSTDATTGYVFCRLDGPDTYVAGTTIWWDGLQVERVPSGTTTPTPFTSSYYGGSVFRDLVGSNNGTLTNYPTYNGDNLGALVFDGANDFVLSSSIATYGNNTTWEAWVYCTDNVSTYNMFMGRYLPYFGFYAGHRFIFSNIIGGTQCTIYTPPDLALNTWYHATFTTSYDGTNTTMRTYVNGVETASGVFAGTQGNYSTNFMVGDGNNYYNTSWYPFQGRISNVKVYNRTLTTSEIQQNFNATRGRYGI